MADHESEGVVDEGVEGFEHEDAPRQVSNTAQLVVDEELPW